MKKKQDELPLNKALPLLRKRLYKTAEEFWRIAGVSASLIYSFEGGRREPSENFRARIVKGILDMIDAEIRKEQEERLLAFAGILDGVAGAPGVSGKLLTYCVGQGERK